MSTNFFCVHQKSVERTLAVTGNEKNFHFSEMSSSFSPAPGWHQGLFKFGPRGGGGRWVGLAGPPGQGLCRSPAGRQGFPQFLAFFSAHSTEKNFDPKLMPPERYLLDPSSSWGGVGVTPWVGRGPRSCKKFPGFHGGVSTDQCLLDVYFIESFHVHQFFYVFFCKLIK